MNSPRNVLVTGASSGIGFSAAQRLARSGWQVFGGVRSESAASRLREVHAAIRPVLIDITVAEQIESARATVETAVGAAGLQGIVNNAGVGLGGALEHQPVSEVRRIFETNVIGHMAVTQEFLPLVRRGRGRIVFVGSGAGSVALPFFTAYAGTKFAIEGITDALRRELRSWGIPVVNVEPGTVNTPILERGSRDFDRLLKNLPAEALQDYADGYRMIWRLVDRAVRTAIAPESVAAAIQVALESRHPRRRYPVGAEAWFARFARLMPAAFVDAFLVLFLRQVARTAPAPARQSK